MAHQVMISHLNVIAQSLQMQPITPSDHDKVLAVLPCFHSQFYIRSFGYTPLSDSQLLP